MAGRDAAGEKFSPGSRKYDRTIDDALKTMERLAVWLEMASEENIWLQVEDPLQTAMLQGMLTHLHAKIETVLAVGGEEVENTASLMRILGRKDP